MAEVVGKPVDRLLALAGPPSLLLLKTLTMTSRPKAACVIRRSPHRHPSPTPADDKNRQVGLSRKTGSVRRAGDRGPSGYGRQTAHDLVDGHPPERSRCLATASSKRRPVIRTIPTTTSAR